MVRGREGEPHIDEAPMGDQLQSTDDARDGDGGGGGIEVRNSGRVKMMCGFTCRGFGM